MQSRNEKSSNDSKNPFSSAISLSFLVENASVRKTAPLNERPSRHPSSVTLLNLEVENTVNVVRLDVQKDHVAADDDVPATATLGRRWQTPLQDYRHWLDLLLQSRRQCAALTELLFETRGKPVALGEPRREATLVFVIPRANRIPIIRAAHNVFVGVVIIVLVFIVSFSMPFSLSES